MPIGTSPATTAGTSSVEPLYGMCTRFTPAALLISISARCAAEPTPYVPNENLAGSALTRRIRSASVLALTLEFTTSISGSVAIAPAGTNSLFGSKGTVASISGRRSVTLTVTRKAEPSCGPLTTADAPTRVLAPGLLSTMTGTPHFGARRSARIRARTSLGPPGGKGTTRRTGP